MTRCYTRNPHAARVTANVFLHSAACLKSTFVRTSIVGDVDATAR